VSYTDEYPRPAVTVDLALFTHGARRDLRVLLVRRRQPPFRGRWALPGGFVDADEDLVAAARRELREETGGAAGPLRQLGAYGAPGRDPRGHTVSVVFLAALAPDTALVAGDDAADCAWQPSRRPPPLAFDHALILRDARRELARLADAPAALARALPLPRHRRPARALCAAAGRRRA